VLQGFGAGGLLDPSCSDAAGLAASGPAGGKEVTRLNFLQPERIALGGNWQDTSLKGAITGQPPMLNLNRVTPEMLKGLSLDQARDLMQELGKHNNVKAYVQTADGSTGPAPTRNAAALMAAKTWATGDTAAFAKVFAADPGRVMPFLNGRGAGALTAGHLADIVKEMRASGRKTDTEERGVLGALVQKYLETNVGKDPKKIDSAMRALVAQMECSGLPSTPENAGLLVGSLISGMLKHFDQIDANVARRKEFIGNLAGFASDLGGASNAWGAVISPAISGLNFLYQEWDQVPNSQSVARKLQGHVGGEWAELGRPPGWSREDVGWALDWIGFSLQANGFGS
jgi:hypothetical protein